MEEIQFDSQLRQSRGTSAARSLRRQGFIPGVIYGGEHESLPIQVNRVAFERLERQHRGESIILHLNVFQDSKKVKDYPVLIKDIQYDPVSDRVQHIDFNRISLTEEVEVKVPILIKGTAIGVKRDSGTLEHRVRELPVVCLPTKIPQHFEVEVSLLGIHDAIHVKDIVLPDGVRTPADPEQVVVTVVPSTREEVVAPDAAAASPTEPEVLKEKKDKDPAQAKSADGQEKKEGK